MQSLINQSVLIPAIKQQIHAAMLESSEALVAESVKKYEESLRKKLATIISVLLEREIDFCRDRENLLITVRHAYPIQEK